MFGSIGNFHSLYQTYLEGFTGGGGLFGQIDDNSKKIQDSAYFLNQIAHSTPNQVSNQILNVSKISVLQEYTNYSTSFMTGIILLLLATVFFIMTLMSLE
jgi:hypothetical protein